jgi:hypothetical protein
VSELATLFPSRTAVAVENGYFRYRRILAKHAPPAEFDSLADKLQTKRSPLFGQRITKCCRMRENSQEHLGSQEMHPFKAGSPAPSHIGGCRKIFPFAVAQLPKIGEAGGEVSEPTRTSRDRVQRVATLPASFASGAIPPTCNRSHAGVSLPTSGDWTSSVEV